MFRNYLAAALSNLARNRLYAAISIVGLAVGMAAAILTGLYIRDELTFDQALAGHERTYLVVARLSGGPRGPQVIPNAPDQVARQLKLDFPEIEATARLATSDQTGLVSVRRGEREAYEDVAWADPDFFAVMPFASIAGDPVAALGRPDAVVLTREMARKYFGRDTPVGETLELNRTSLFRVAAVIEDLPGNSNVTNGIFASSRAPVSRLARSDARPLGPGQIRITGRAYVRLRDAASAARLNAAMPAFSQRHLQFTPAAAPPVGPGPAVRQTPGPPAERPAFVSRLGPGERPPRPGNPGAFSMQVNLVPIGQVHFYPFTGGQARGSLPVLYTLGGIAALILVVAGVNFVNLMTARAARRAVEVGVRKAAGAARRDLVLQFLGEALIYAVLAMILAAALAELMLPALNDLVLRHMRFAYWSDVGLLIAVAGLTLGMGVLAGLYPAFVLSAFKPALALKGGAPATAGSQAVRTGLVVLQFSILIALILATVVIWRQTRFLLDDGVRVDHDQVLTIASPCNGRFVEPLKALPGVRAVTCSTAEALNLGARSALVPLPDGRTVEVAETSIDFDFFDLFGVKPIAGRLLSRNNGADLVAPPTPEEAVYVPSPKTVVVNQAAVHALGFKNADDALDKPVRFGLRDIKDPTVIVGVVDDFGFDLTRGPTPPTAYFVAPAGFSIVSAKLTGRQIPETLRAIDGLWRRAGELRPIQRRFVDEMLQATYATTIRQGVLVGALAAIAVFIAALGLFGLAAFTAERRTKEIGVRKAMGASRGDILALLLWQFTRPVLWGACLALPLGWWAMDHWLKGFAYRVALQPWQFAAALVLALVVAWATVFVHALKVARAKPVHALRYE